MDKASDVNSKIEIFKSLGHKSRTLLNGITGPIQIIRSLSDDPNLIEPLRMLELNVARFDKYSLRSLMLAELIKNEKWSNPKKINLVETVKYLVLDLTDFLDFYNIRVDIQNDQTQPEITIDFDLLYNFLMILLEQIIALSTEGSAIKIEYLSSRSSIECLIKPDDNGIIHKSLNPILMSGEFSPDVDLYLLKLGGKLLNAQLEIGLNSANHSEITLKLS